MDRSWVQSYEAVDFDLPVPSPEQQRMLQDGPRSPTRPPSSPLNPALAAPPPPNGPASPFARPLSRGSSAYINRIASEESRAFASLSPSVNTSGSRGSMILYRRADVGEDGALAPPPARSHLNRNSVYSTSGDSIVSLSSDSKYPAFTQERGLIAYAWDPTLDDDGGPVTPEDILHDPREKSPKSAILSMRGFLNIGVLILLILAILALFVVYPAIKTVSDTGVDQLITFNTRINATGQAVDRRDVQAFLARPVDPASPAHPQLLLSDEFSAASDLWQPRPPPSRNGHLVLVPTQPLALSTFLCAPAQGHVEIGLSRRRTLVYNWDAEPNTIALTLVFVFPALVESNIDYIRVYGQQPQDCPMAEPRTLQIDVAS